MSEIDNALKSAFNFKFNEALDTFRRLIEAKKRAKLVFRENADDPRIIVDDGPHVYSLARCLLHEVEILMLRSLVTENNDLIEAAMKRLNDIRDLAEKQIDFLSTVTSKSTSFFSWSRKPDPPSSDELLYDLDVRMVATIAQLWVAIIQFRTAQYISGSVNLRSAWKRFHELYDLYVLGTHNQGADAPRIQAPAFLVADLYYFVGCFHFFVSLIPPAFRWVVEALGFEGDREAGRRELYYALSMCSAARAQEPAAHRFHQPSRTRLNWTNPSCEGMIYFTWIWISTLFYEDYLSANKLYDQAMQVYPTSVMLLFMGAYLSRKAGNIEEAIRRFTLAGQYAHEIAEVPRICMYETAWCHYILCDFEQAALVLEQFLAGNPSPSFRAFAGYQLGYCYQLMESGDESRFVKSEHVLRQVEGWARKHYSFDQFASRKATMLLRKGRLTLGERLLLISVNQYDSLNYLRATQTLLRIVEEAALDFSRPDDNVATFFFLKGRLASRFSKSESARRCLEVAIQAAQEETFIPPFAYTEYADHLIESLRLAPPLAASLTALLFPQVEAEPERRRKHKKSKKKSHHHSHHEGDEKKQDGDAALEISVAPSDLPPDAAPAAESVAEVQAEAVAVVEAEVEAPVVAEEMKIVELEEKRDEAVVYGVGMGLADLSAEEAPRFHQFFDEALPEALLARADFAAKLNFLKASTGFQDMSEAKEHAKWCLTKAGAYREYDFYNHLTRRINVMLERLSTA